MAEVDNSYVRHGFWIDWSRGPVLGSTLTTSPKVGNTIVAVLALTVTLATSHFWSLLLFLFYQYRARNAYGDGLFHQQQVTLRSLPTPEAFAVDTFKLYLSWLKRVQHGPSRSLYLSLAALGYFLAALTAGVFSSSVVTTSDLLLLLDGKHCASLDIVNAWSLGKGTGNQAYSNQVITVSEQYANRCYDEGTSPSECNIYVQPSIQSSMSMVPCPFDPSLCVGNGSVAVAFDSGLVDSRTHLGINTPSNDRIQFRKRTTCAPLVEDGYSAYVSRDSIDQSDRTIPGDEYFILFYGTKDTLSGATFASSVYTAKVLGFYATRAGYWFKSPEAENFTTCQVNTTLQRSDADTILLGISNNAIIAESPINDPIFAYHEPWVYENVTFYGPDTPVSAIGCIEQYQICINDGKDCSPLQANAPHKLMELPVGVSPFHISVVQLLTQAIWISDVGTGYNLRESSSFLKASEQVSSGIVSSLPDNQWIIEMKFAVNWAWSGIQRVVQDHATGFQGVPEEAMLMPQTDVERKFCQSQLVKKNGGFANISFFGLSFIVAVSGCLVLMSFIPLRILISSKRCTKLFSPAVDRWNQDGPLQIQRRVFQGYGHGKWSKLDREIPVTHAGEILPRISTLPPMVNSASHSLTNSSSSYSKTNVSVVEKVSSPSPALQSQTCPSSPITMSSTAKDIASNHKCTRPNVTSNNNNVNIKNMDEPQGKANVTADPKVNKSIQASNTSDIATANTNAGRANSGGS